MSHSSSESADRQIRIQRDGLRLFRCRSKSRPYRTWAIMSGDKLILYFGAESEIQAQNWMQEVRDGLWPSCFSFQMLTACSHEVSLIDDENTFLSGLLGVYGRFVLTSEDVISLMHPHWGSTLLQISLTNVQDVLFVREAEIPPAGVFSIILKTKEDSKVKALQFFCNTAMDAIQWILNEVYTKNGERNYEVHKNRFWTEPSTFVTDYFVSPANNTVNLKFRNTDSSNVNPSISTYRIDDTNINIVDSKTDYENLQYLKKNSVLHTEECITYNGLNSAEFNEVNKKRSLEDAPRKTSWNHSNTNGSSINAKKEADDSQNLVNMLSNFKLNEGNFYANVVCVTDSTNVESQKCNNNVNDSVVSNNSSPKYMNISISSEHFDLKDEIASPATTDDALDFVIDSILNKRSTLKNSLQRITQEQFSVDESSRNIENTTNNHLLEMKNSKLDDTEFSFQSSSIKHENGEITNSVAGLGNSVNSNGRSTEIRTKCEKTVHLNVDFSSEKKLSTFHSLCESNSHVYGVVNKQMSSCNSSEQMQETQFSTNSFSQHKGSKAEILHLLPNITSDFLNTSINNSISKNKQRSDDSSSDVETRTVPWVEDEFSTLDFSNRIYEDISDRKGTIYEEIDALESDDESTFQLPPALPRRPQNLEIPNSLRLQKLSKSIKQTLEVIDSTVQPTKKYPRPTFIKKIKEVSRIMQINPTHESSREPFTIETKLPTDGKNMLILTPTAVNPLVNMDNAKEERNAIYEPRHGS